MKKIYHLSTCSTCKRILKELKVDDNFDLQDIKTNPLTENQLEELKDLAGSYEALFSKLAQLYKSKGLKDQTLSEGDYKSLILEHYTFLKRPVMVFGEQIFIGNSPKTVEAAKAYLRTNE
ncbi:MAG: ArsC/Spx/MgsR family protein [Bacteroidota bacterium]